MNDSYKKLFTIGYSGFTMPDFIKALVKHSIGAVVDVRSSPYSKHWPEFNQPQLKQSLNENGIYYLAMGDSLGARPNDHTLYTHGTADFKKMAASSFFIEGCKRVISGLMKHSIALLCAENDPICCHRTILVAQNINIIEPKVAIFHIHRLKETESHQNLVNRLLSLHHLDQEDLLRSYEQRLSMAFDMQENKIAYKES